VAHAIDLILDHMHLVDQKMKIISGALEKTGVKVNLDMPQIEMENLENSPASDYPQRDSTKENS
jgi:serine O-acetyltransferase